MTSQQEQETGAQNIAYEKTISQLSTNMLVGPKNLINLISGLSASAQKSSGMYYLSKLQTCENHPSIAQSNTDYIDSILALKGIKNKTLFFPPGTFCFKTILLEKASGVNIIGAGADSAGTKLVLAGTSNTLFLIKKSTYVTVSDLSISAANPHKKQHIFHLSGKNWQITVQRIQATQIGRFAKAYGDMLNISFEEIDLDGVHSPVFYFDAPGQNEQSVAQPVSLLRVKGRNMIGSGAWVRFGAAASINLHALDFEGGRYAIHSMRGKSPNPRYLTGQDLNFKGQSGSAVYLQAGLGVQFNRLNVTNCNQTAVRITGSRKPSIHKTYFNRGVQLGDMTASGCQDAAIVIKDVDYVSIINPQFTLPGTASGIRLVGKVKNGVIYGGGISGPPSNRKIDTSSCSDCSSFEERSVANSVSDWSPLTPSYTSAMDEIFARRNLYQNSQAIQLVVDGNENSLQTAIKNVCTQGGTILIGPEGVLLTKQIKVSASCRGIDFISPGRSDSYAGNGAKFVISTPNAGLLISGEGHSLRRLAFISESATKNDSLLKPLIVDTAQNILLDANNFTTLNRGILVQNTQDLFFYNNRYKNIYGHSLLLKAEAQGNIKDVRMLLETSSCFYEADGKITNDNCLVNIGIGIHGGVEKLTSLQNAYIQGGSAHIIAGQTNSRPQQLKFFQMGSDNPHNYSLDASNVASMNIDSAWFGQGQNAIRLTGGKSSDSIRLTGVQLQSTTTGTVFNSQNSNASIRNFGGWYRIGAVKVGQSTSMTAMLFEGLGYDKTASSQRTNHTLVSSYKSSTRSIRSSELLFMMSFPSARANSNDNEDEMPQPVIDAAGIITKESWLELITTAYQQKVGAAIPTSIKTEFADDLDNGETSDEITERIATAVTTQQTLFIEVNSRTPSTAERKILVEMKLLGASDADLAARARTLEAQRLASVAATSANCSLSNNAVPHGGSITAWRSSLVAFGAKCESEVRSCTNGRLTGSFSHTFCRTAPFTGVFSIGGNGSYVEGRTYYSNGVDAFCRIYSKTEFDFSRPGTVVKVAENLPTMANHGDCGPTIFPAVFFTVNGNGTVYKSDGRSTYCGVANPADFEALKGKWSEVVNASHLPRAQQNSGVCKVPLKQSGLRWSFNGPISGMTCSIWNEGADPHSWNDNYLCWPRNLDAALRFSSAGPISGLNCTRIDEAADQAGTWNDNYLCSPKNNDIQWSSTGALPGKQCIQIKEPSEPAHTGWHDNYLCHDPVDGQGVYKEYSKGLRLESGRQEWISTDAFIIMQTDGNLVLYDHNRPKWASGTSGKCTNCFATFQSDGNFVIYNAANGVAVYSSETFGSAQDLQISTYAPYMQVRTTDGRKIAMEPVSSGCTLDGKQVFHGGTIQAFQAKTVPFGQACKSETRTCSNKRLSGQYSHTSCKNDSFEGVFSLGGNGTYVEGKTYYSNGVNAFCRIYSKTEFDINRAGTTVRVVAHMPTLANHGDCQPPPFPAGVFRVTNQHTIYKSNGSSAYCSYASATDFHNDGRAFDQVREVSHLPRGMNNNGICQVTPPQPCTFNGQTIAHGGAITAWKTVRKNAQGRCESQQRVCTNGRLSGTFGHSFCN